MTHDPKAPIETIAEDGLYSQLHRLATMALEGTPIFCVAHARPDADAIATACATAEILKRIAGDADAPVYAALQDADSIPEALAWVANDAPVAPAIAAEDPYIFLACDFSANWGLSEAGRKALEGALEVAAIDHHPLDPKAKSPQNRPIADEFSFLCVDAEAAAAAEVVVRGIVEAHRDSPEKIERYLGGDLAQTLMNGMSADSLALSTTQTTPKTLEAASKLVGLGASLDAAAEHVWKKKPLEVLKAEARILASPSLGVTKDGRIAHAAFTKEELLPLTTPEGGITANIAGVLSRIEGPDLCFFARELPDGSAVVGSVRSRQGFSARNVALSVGGGGHENASGFKVAGGKLTEVADTLLQAARAEIERADAI